MKKFLRFMVLVTIMCCGIGSANAGNFNEKVSQIVELENAKKAQIFEVSKIWAIKKFKSADIIQYENEKEGTILLKGSGVYDSKSTIGNTIQFILKIDIKDDKVRLTFSDGVYQLGELTEMRREEIRQIGLQPFEVSRKADERSAEDGRNAIKRLYYSIVDDYYKGVKKQLESDDW